MDFICTDNIQTTTSQSDLLLFLIIMNTIYILLLLLSPFAHQQFQVASATSVYAWRRVTNAVHGPGYEISLEKVGRGRFAVESYTPFCSFCCRGYPRSSPRQQRTHLHSPCQ